MQNNCFAHVHRTVSSIVFQTVTASITHRNVHRVCYGFDALQNGLQRTICKVRLSSWICETHTNVMYEYVAGSGCDWMRPTTRDNFILQNIHYDFHKIFMRSFFNAIWCSPLSHSPGKQKIHLVQIRVAIVTLTQSCAFRFRCENIRQIITLHEWKLK